MTNNPKPLSATVRERILAAHPELSSSLPPEPTRRPSPPASRPYTPPPPAHTDPPPSGPYRGFVETPAKGAAMADKAENPSAPPPASEPVPPKPEKSGRRYTRPFKKAAYRYWLSQQGKKSTEAIAADMGLQSSTIHYIVKELAPPNRRAKKNFPPHPQRAQVVERVLDRGEQQAAVARELGLGQSVVSRWILEARRERAAAGKKRAAPPAPAERTLVSRPTPSEPSEPSDGDEGPMFRLTVGRGLREFIRNEVRAAIREILGGQS